MVCLFAACACLLFVYAHAFRRSIGTGVMVLCVPFYLFYYAFFQFEHPRKNWLIAGSFGLLGLGVALLGAVQATLGLGAPPLPPS